MTGTGTTATMTYPLLSWFRDLQIYGQSFAVDASVTALTASQSHQVVIGGYEPYTRIYNTSSSTSPTGSIQHGVGIVTEITY